MPKDYYENVSTLIDPFLTELGVDLVELSIKKQNRIYNIEIITDKPAGGITIDECGELNKRISHQLEEIDIIPAPYVVSVSSPGMDRPLKTNKDFKRVIGRNVRFYLAEKISERLEHTGKVMHAEDISVKISTENGDISIPYNIINKAIQVIE